MHEVDPSPWRRRNWRHPYRTHPRHFTVTILPGGPCFAARPDETLLEAARRDGVALPHECVWGSCGTCEVALVSGETVLLCPAAPAISPRDQRSGCIVAGQSMARSDLAIRLSPAAPPSLPVPDLAHRAEPIAVEELGPELRRFTSGPKRRPISRPGNMPSSTSRRGSGAAGRAPPPRTAIAGSPARGGKVNEDPERDGPRQTRTAMPGMAAAAPATAGDIRPGWFGQVGLANVAFSEGASVSAGGNTIPGAGATLSDDVTPGFGVGCRLTDRFSIIAIGGLPPTTTIEGTGPLEGKAVGKVSCGLLIVAANYRIPTRGRFQPLAGAGFNHTIGFDT